MQQQKTLSRRRRRLRVVSPDSMTTPRCTAKDATMYIGVGESLKLRRRAVYRNWIGWAITLVRRRIDWTALLLMSFIVASIWAVVKGNLI